MSSPFMVNDTYPGSPIIGEPAGRANMIFLSGAGTCGEKDCTCRWSRELQGTGGKGRNPSDRGGKVA